MGIRYIIRTHKLKRLIKTIKKYFTYKQEGKEYTFTWTESLERELWGGKR